MWLEIHQTKIQSQLQVKERGEDAFCTVVQLKGSSGKETHVYQDPACFFISAVLSHWWRAAHGKCSVPKARLQGWGSEHNSWGIHQPSPLKVEFCEEHSYGDHSY